LHSSFYVVGSFSVSFRSILRFSMTDSDVISIARADASLTHPNPIAQDASACYVLAIGTAASLSRPSLTRWWQRTSSRTRATDKAPSTVSAALLSTRPRRFVLAALGVGGVGDGHAQVGAWVEQSIAGTPEPFASKIGYAASIRTAPLV
jgi:hypothetical protein